MSGIWQARDLQNALGVPVPAGWSAQGVAIDSRELRAGELFVALVGARRDGHAFLAEAAGRGAAGCVVHRDGLAAGGVPLFRVDDTLEALRALGAHARKRSRARVLAITGSVGKTGTKAAVAELLAAQGPTHASRKSHNNHIGVPLSLANLPEQARFAVFELGMNHAGEIRRLVAQVRPQVALVTWVAAAHLGHFADETEIACTKAEIFTATPPPEVAILPRDNPHYALLRERAAACGVREIITFGCHPESHWRVVHAELDAEGSRVRARTPAGMLEFQLALLGRHWVHNSLAVLAAVAALGGDAAGAAARFAELRPLPGRGQRIRLKVPGGSVLLLDDSYNANPASMRAAIEVLARQPGRRLAALGEMAELGRSSAELHAALAEPLQAAGVFRVFTCGDHMRHLHDRLPEGMRGDHAEDAGALVGRLVSMLRAGDVLLVKGSLASGMNRVVAALCAAFAVAED